MKKLSKATILIGPEGGLSDAEIKQAIEGRVSTTFIRKKDFKD